MNLHKPQPVSRQFDAGAALQKAHAHWNAGQAPQAEQFCRLVLAVVPYQAEALHLLGLMAHAYGRHDLAITHLRQACFSPQAPAIYFSNLAEMCRQRGLLGEAEQVARRAVLMAPELIAAWSNLGIILQESGRFEASLECLQKVVDLKPDSAQARNNLANTCMRLGQVGLAREHYESAIRLNPFYAEAHSNLAFLLSGQGLYDEAVAAGRLAIEHNPQLAPAYLNLAEAERALGRPQQALHWLAALQAFAPVHADALVAQALILKQLERFDEAMRIAAQVVAQAPQHAGAHNIAAQVLQALGRDQEALAAFERAAGLPGLVAEEALTARATLLAERGDAVQSQQAFERARQAFPPSVRVLAAAHDSKKYRPGDPDIVAMEAALGGAVAPPVEEQLALRFALGKAYLDCADSARAFVHLDAGNRLKRTRVNYDAAKIQRLVEDIIAVFTPARMEQLRHLAAATPSATGAADGVRGAQPVFIVGMPRSGTTLIEQILASHPQVSGAGELTIMKRAIEARGPFPEQGVHWQAGDLEKIGATYLREIAGLAAGRAFVIDKLPANFFYAGLLPLFLPGARIIHCRRDAIDTCLSCYSKLFSGEQPFSYDQQELGHFYRCYSKLMAHWRAVLPEASLLEVDYEAVVDDLETQARRLTGFLGLPWDQACLRFHETRRTVRTASANQVRLPIYAASKGRWRAHAAQLAPLLAALKQELP